jgi:hypothetical protein
LRSESRPAAQSERTIPLRYRIFVASIQQSTQRESKSSKDAAAEAEAIRINRLREDARRPMSVNLAETIALSHALLKMADAAQRQ